MTDVGGPLTSREAMLFEDAAGCAVMAAVAQLRAGELSTGAAVAALFVLGRRKAADVAVVDVFDTYPKFADLIEAGTEALEQLLADEEG